MAKFGAKIPALAKLATSLKKVEKIIPDNVADKLRKTEKATDKVDEAIVPPNKKKPDLKETFDEKRAKFEEEFDALKKTPDYLSKRKAKFDAYKKKKGAKALDEVTYNKKYDQLFKNREIGRIGEETFKDFMDGYKSEIALPTKDGPRFIDNIKPGTKTAREIKTGKVGNTSSIKRQIKKDLEILKDGDIPDIQKIEWHFLDGLDPQLEKELKKIQDILGKDKFDYKDYTK